MESDSFGPWRDAAFRGLVVLLASSLVLWCGWVTVIAAQTLKRADIELIVQKQAPYVIDKRKIDMAIELIHRDRADMLAVIRANTSAIQGIERQMASQTAVLDRLNKNR